MSSESLYHFDIYFSGNPFPECAKRYVARLADLVETPICLVSVGRRRDQTIILDPEMMQM